MRNSDDLIVNVVELLALIALVAICVIFVRSAEVKTWNNGYCSCGGSWKYLQAVGHKVSTTYIYQCDKCGEIHEFLTIR